MKKRYFVRSELYAAKSFENESDRNEMALALWQEHCYCLWARTLNWYGNGIMTGIEEDANMNVETWEEEFPTEPIYFNTPTQVAFWDVDGDHYIGGIAYGDEIICCCCGGVISIEEVREFAPEGVEPIVVYDEWVDLSRDILEVDEKSFGMED